MRRPRLIVLHALFFLSGVAGLVYEVAWVRQFGNALGNTVHSASLVTAAYMCGLGVGSYWAGAWSDRQVRLRVSAPLRAYATAELCIAALGLGLAVLLPRLGGLSAGAAYARGADGWFEPSFAPMALRYGVAAGLLMPPTLLMGATFTLLVRFVLTHDVKDAGWRVGALYGVNTAGAAAGALLTDLALVPAVGLFRAQVCAALVQIAVGVAALVMAKRDATAPPEPNATPSESTAPRRTLGAACGALFLSGFAALGMEIVWFRSLSCSLGAFRPVFSVVLAVILVGIWLGATAGGYAHKRYGRPLELFVIAQAMFVVVALVLMATYRMEGVTLHPVKSTLVATLRVVLLPALLMGFSMPLANAIVQDTLGQVGRRAGALYLANTVGSVAGSLVAGFMLAERLSSQQSFAVFAACAALAPLPLFFVTASWPRSLRISVLASAALVIPAISAWLALPANYLVASFFPLLPADQHVLAIGEGSNEIIVVTDDAKGARWLITNGHPMSANSLYAQRYMRAFSHIPLLMTDHPETALVICFGVGNTMHAASLHSSLERLEVADLSRNVLEHASFFRASNHDVLHDRRVRVFVDDGRQHLRTQAPGTYDLITLEPPPISFAGVSALYSREFYELARSRLKPGGYMTQWLPAYQVPPETGLEMVRAFIDVFPSAVLLSGEGTELILLGTPGPEVVLDLDRVEAGLRREPAVQADLTRVHLGTLTEIAGTFLAGPGALRQVTAGALPVTDDRPSMEYTFWRTAEAPASFFGRFEGLRAFCPTCFDGEKPVARVADLDTYLEALRRLYATPAFRQNRQSVVMDTTGGVAEVIQRDPYLRSLLGVKDEAPTLDALRERARREANNPQAHFALAYALGNTGALEEASAEQRRGLELAPRDADAQYNLAAIEASLGREDLAIRAAEQAVRLNPDQAQANAMLCSIFRARGDPRADEPCRRTRGR